MFLTNLISYLKGALKKMFSKNQIQQVVNEEITLSSSMINAYELWENMLCGRAPWVEGTDPNGVKSLAIESNICTEFANTALSEMEASLEIPELDEIFQRTIGSMNTGFQDALGLGEMAIKPIGDTGISEIIPADRIIPFEFGSDGKLKKCAFIQVKPRGEQVVFYRFEIHELLPEGLRIANKAYKGSYSNIGSEIPLTDIDEWATLIPDVTYQGMDRMDFGFYKNPLPNRVDGSPNGVSIFSKAVEQIRKADIQFGRLDWEYESGERAVFGDYLAFDTKVDSFGKKHFIAPKGKERMFVGVNVSAGDQDFWQDHSPELRDANYIAGLDEYLRKIELSVGLAYGDLSRVDSTDKTAEEVKQSKKRKYDTVTAIQNELRNCLEDYAYALAFYHGMYHSHIGFQCMFHDSIRVDDETQRMQDRTDVQLCVMSKLEYRMKWYGEDEHLAADALAKVKEEIQQDSENEGVIS